MPNIGIPELLIILVVIVIIFGVGRLPEIGGALGRGIKEFRSAAKDEDPKQLDSKTQDAPTRPEPGEKGGTA